MTSHYQIIHNEILKNIEDEGEIDLSEASDCQIEAEIFNRYQLRVIGECMDKMTEFFNETQGFSVYQDNKDIMKQMADFVKQQTPRFSLNSKY